MKKVLTIFDVPPSIDEPTINEPEPQLEVKKKRGRPAKVVTTEEIKLISESDNNGVIKKRGRPAKEKIIETRAEELEHVLIVNNTEKTHFQTCVEQLEEKEYQRNKNLFYLLTTFSSDYYIVSYDQYKHSYIGYVILKIGTEKECVAEKTKRSNKEHLKEKAEENVKSVKKVIKKAKSNAEI